MGTAHETVSGMNRPFAWLSGGTGLLAVVVCLAAAEFPFSHRLHLERGASCLDCHPSAKTSRETADVNLPQGKECSVCHDGAQASVVDASPLSAWKTGERSFRFNHAFHLQLGNLAPVLAVALDEGTYLGKVGDLRAHLTTGDPCQACHRGLNAADLATSVHLPQMSDCLVCHSEIDNPYSCEKCHLEAAQLKPGDHTLEFIDQHATGKLDLDHASCLPCHGRNFSCKGCH